MFTVCQNLLVLLSLRVHHLLTSRNLFQHPIVHHGRNLRTVLLQEPKMAVPVNAPLTQLNPLGAATRLLQVINNAVIIRHMRTRLARQRNKRHARNLRQLQRRLNLHETAPLRQRILADARRIQLVGAGDGRNVVDGGVGQAPGTGGGAADGGGGVAGVALEGDDGGLEVDVAGDEGGAVVGEQDWVQRADGVRDEERGADEREQRAARGAHRELLRGEVGRQRDEAGLEGVEVGVAFQAGARPLRVVLRLRVGVGQLGRGEALLADFGRGADAHGVVGEVFGAAAADGGLVEEVDLVAVVQEVRGEALAVVRGVEPCLWGSSE